MKNFTMFLLTAMLIVGMTTMAFASSAVTAVAVGAQTGTVTYGTAGSATYTVTLTMSFSGTAGSSVMSLTGTSLPTGATAKWSTGTGTGTKLTVNSTTNTVTLPARTTSGNILLTITTTAATAAGATTGITAHSATNSVTSSAFTFTVSTAALSVTASADSKQFGLTKTYGSGSTAFTSSGLKNSDAIGSVTLAASGGTAALDAIGSYTLTPSAAVFSTGTSSNYAITYHTGTLSVVAGADHLVFATQPNGLDASQILDPQPVVNIVDASGNLFSCALSVNLSLTTIPAGATATLGGTTSQTTSAGVATYSDIKVNTDAIGEYGITATVTGLPTPSVASTTWSFGALPVELSTFSAVGTRSGAVLAWKTATEKNNFGFNIERRTVGTTVWNKVGFVAGHGTSNIANSYSYTDANVAAGTYAYRVAQVDNDGAMKTYSESQVTVGAAAKVLSLGNYPNPFNPTTRFEFTVPNDGMTTVKVYNVLGQEVLTVFNGEVKAGEFQHATFNGSKFSSGVYFYAIENNGQKMIKRMLMLK